MEKQLRVAVIGCGLIGTRRAEQVVRHPRTSLAVVVDTDPSAAEAAAVRFGCRSSLDRREVVGSESIDIVVAATPNGHLRDIAVEALNAGKHVLAEKPMGRNLAEAEEMAGAAAVSERLLKIGFNHRYHPAIARAKALVEAGTIGAIVNARVRYGHGGRPGYEREWRADAESAGGGELTDQGAHVCDLLHWFVGRPYEAFAYLQTAFWPISPLEDNAFGLFRFPGGAVASMHTSWTQWKNLFSFELFASHGSVHVRGLGGSYGTERLTIARRKPEGGAPDSEETVYDGPDLSWAAEWDEFVGAIVDGTPYSGSPADGVAAARMIDALYRSARASRPVPLADGAGTASRM